MGNYYTTAYKSYEKASELTGLSQIKLHKLRICGVARHKTSGYPDHTPLINVEDVRAWMKLNGK